MNKLNVTGIILAHNEEEVISRCIKSLSFCKEVLVIDDNSTDRTTLISKKQNAKVHKHSLNNDFSSQRNWAITKAKYDWIFFVDADEVISNSLKKEIQKNTTHNSKYSGFYITRRDYLWGKLMKYGEVGSFGSFGNAKLLRLGKKNRGTWERSVHETWNIKGDIGILEGVLEHYPHPTMNEFISDVSKRSKMHAQDLIKEGKYSSIFKVIAWPVGKLLYNQTIKLGFRDGIQGFLVAMIMSFHSFLSWSDIWLKHHSKK